MEILTFPEAATHFEVSLATISRWVKQGKLVEGPKAGKFKTVTKKSVDALSTDNAFQIGIAALQKKRGSSNKGAQLEDFITRVQEIENTLKRVLEEISELHKFAKNCTNEIEKIQKEIQIPKPEKPHTVKAGQSKKSGRKSK